MSQALKAEDYPDQVALGVAAALFAMLLFGVTETVGKWLTGGFNPTQILLVRAVFALGMAAALAIGNGGRAVLETRQPWIQILRGVTAATAMVLALFAYAALPLAEAVSVVYAAPILVTLLSVPLLGEPLGWRRLTAVLIGFLGVILIVRPGGDLFQPAALIALAALVLYALSNVLTRKAGRTDRGLTTLIYTQICFIAVCAPAQPFVWSTPHGLDAWLFLLVAATGGVAQYLLTLSYRHAPAALIAPFDYTAILWATLFAFLIWSETPTLLSWIGMAVVIASGAYIAVREIIVSPPQNTGPVYLGIRRRVG